MPNRFENEFKNAINSLCFSPYDKERIAKNIMYLDNQEKSGKDIIMNKFTIPKMAAAIAAGVMVIGGTAFAASKIAMYTSSSHSAYDYNSVQEINSAVSEFGSLPEFPETLSGYTFDGGNVVHVSGKSDTGKTIENWDDIRAVYADENGSRIYFSISPFIPDEDERIPTDSRTIGGIDVVYNYDEYLFLNSEKDGLDEATAERMNTDDHFFVSYGGEETSTSFFSGVAFVKDDIRYHVFSTDEISEDELFKIAEEIILR